LRRCRSIALLLVFLTFPVVVVAGYPDREQLARDMDRLEEYLRKAQATEGPVCTPDSLATAQAYLARAKEEFQEGDLWEAEDAIRRCEAEAEGIWEKILVCGNDLDRDGVPDRRDRCPNDPETYNDYMDEDGCPDRVPRMALLTQDKIEMLVPIVFDEETQRPIVDKDSVLLEVARIMEENPTLRFSIQAHLDNRLPPEEAEAITRVRAETVKSALVELGVPAGRLEAEGKGSGEPVASNESSWGRLLNDRVELIRIP
jgi:outer membrane protein OmpA-like peptidoglycan-associated protein